MLIRLAAILVLVLASQFFSVAPVEPSVRVLFVSPDGSDQNPGSENRPFGSITYALKQLQPGDTLLVRGGSYVEQVRNPKLAQGTAEAPISVEAYPGDWPAIVGLLWISDAHYWSFRGINVTWHDSNQPHEQMVKLSGGSHWTFAGAEVWGARSSAAILVTQSAQNWTLRDLYVRDTHPTNDLNQDHLIYVSRGAANGVIERSVLANSENGRAIKIGASDGYDAQPSNIHIRYNTMYNNQGPSNVQLSYGTHGNHIYRNIMVKSREQNVATYRLSGEGNLIYDNVGWESPGMIDPNSSLIDAGGNIMLDPLFTSVELHDYRPLNPAVSAYGRFGEVIPVVDANTTILQTLRKALPFLLQRHE